MNNTVRSIIGTFFIIFMLISFYLNRGWKTDKEKKQDAAVEFRDVDISNQMSLKTLEKVLNEYMPQISTSYSPLKQTHVRFGWGLVDAIFLGIEEDDTRRPLYIHAELPFKGSIYGVHIGDSAEKALSELKKRKEYLRIGALYNLGDDTYSIELGEASLFVSKTYIYVKNNNFKLE